MARQFLERAKQAQANNEPLPVLMEEEIDSLLDNTWGDTAKAIVNNWLGLVYQVTNLDRTRLFMADIDPNDPLGMRT